MFFCGKVLMGKDVLCAPIYRIEWLFETVSSVCLSFSSGKDSLPLITVNRVS
ncbi:phosphoadenosine phosphosulfate reductase [Escherichia coli]|nr:hypothetical protein [Escherichia coli]EFI7447784.1 hypothetical protein [Escherichia coli]STM96549.1 putative phosphoadenosine phosphosulfate reductase [Escherichia coli]GDJ75186.1 phosphoadenosine phosphosulfate reductase [Escherichia coli]GDK60747.1 phosphoadenosine phosphosulfate reductase [Escherichia coli]